jgi:23S rRNA (cytidine1920-2'-O)/16S rRNA (cytidine1409-2'-O)-methyltransferase
MKILKERIDSLLVQKGLVESRNKAQALILEGKVWVGDLRVTKVGYLVPLETDIRLEKPPEFVSRGGKKLEKAIVNFKLEIAQKTALDIGASTGGFTHCLLKYGIAKVYTVDVGKAQLHPEIRNHPRVIALEGFNARYLGAEQVPEPVDVITIDVSFISLEKLLPVITQFLKPRGILLTLIKPQFEAGVKKVCKGGVVKSGEVHVEILTRIIESFYNKGLTLRELTFSPLRGPAGNIEYLAYFIHEHLTLDESLTDKIKAVVEEGKLI